jgi:hypothetical protein
MKRWPQIAVSSALPFACALRHLTYAEALLGSAIAIIVTQPAKFHARFNESKRTWTNVV